MMVVVGRDLVAALRSWRAVVVQLLFLLVPGLLVVLRWPADGQADVGGAAAGQVLRIFGYGLTVGLVLVGPAFPATSIVRERVQGTLALMLNTPLRPAAFLAGKLLGALGLILLLLVLTLPGAAASYAMGGIDLGRQFGRLYLVLALAAVQYGCVGLMVSSRARSLDGALRGTYAIVLVMALVTLLPYRLLSSAAWAGGALIIAADWLRCLSPIPAVVQALGDAGVQSTPSTVGPGLHVKFCVLAMLTGAVCWTLAFKRVSSRPLDLARSAGKITDEQSRKVQAWRRLMYLWFFDPQRRSALIAPWQNPVMVKEQRCRRFGRGGWMMRLIGAYLILSLLLVFGVISMSRSEGVATVLGIIAVMQAALVILLAPSLAAGLISTERESRGWALLQTTPLSVGSIITGKLVSAMLPLGLALAATLPALAVLVGFDPALMRVSLMVIATMAMLAVVAVLISTAVGSLFRSTAPATATAYALMVALCGGTMMFWLGQDAPFGRGLVERVLAVNPLAATLSIVGMPGFGGYRLVPANWYVLAGLAVMSVCVLVVQVRKLSRAR